MSERFGRAIAFVAVGVFAVFALSQLTIPGWWGQDTDAYWQAAQRLRDGQSLYPPLSNPDASDVFRYAPWFAVAWVPLTFLPQPVAYVVWGAAMIAAAGTAVSVPIRRGGFAGILLAILTTSLLLPAAATGNVQPALVAALTLSVERRSGPLWIAVAASLKATPILFAAVYVARGEWIRAGASLFITLVFVVPFLLFDLSAYPSAIGAATGPLALEVALAIAGLLLVATMRWSRSRYAWLAGAAAVLIAMPRWSYYQPTFLLVGLATRPTRSDP